MHATNRLFLPVFYLILIISKFANKWTQARTFRFLLQVRSRGSKHSIKLTLKSGKALFWWVIRSRARGLLESLKFLQRTNINIALIINLYLNLNKNLVYHHFKSNLKATQRAENSEIRSPSMECLRNRWERWLKSKTL